MIDYESIKAAAKEQGLKVTDFLAMSPANDPFYVGTPRDWEMAEWFKEVWDLAGYTDGVHLRRVHYFCVSRPEIRLPKPIKQGDKQSDLYLNTEAAWKYLTQASKMARYLGLIDITDIKDNKNPDPIIGTYYSMFYSDDPYYADHAPVTVWMSSIEFPTVEAWSPYESDIQPALMEVWVEKGTMNDAISSTVRRYGGNLVTFQGEASITAVQDLVDRIEQADKPTRIFYISDFDPAGNSMPNAVSRKLEWLLKKNGVKQDVKVKQIALTQEQVAEYRLPRTPIKDSEIRAGRFEEAFGEGSVELDALEALHPGVLAQIVATELSRYYDRVARDKLYRTQREIERRTKDAIKAIMDEHQELLEKVEELREQVANVEVDTSDLAFEKSDLDVHEVEAEKEWLFAADRSYVKQIGYYKRFKNGTM